MAEYLTPEDVAGIFKIKRIRTIYEWIADGLFPNVICIRKQYRITRQDVDQLIERSKLVHVDQPLQPKKRRVLSRGFN